MKMWFKVLLDGLNHVTYNLKLALKFPSNLLQDKAQNKRRASHKSRVKTYYYNLKYIFILIHFKI